MRYPLGLSSLLIGAAVITAVQPAWAAAVTQVTGVKTSATTTGIEVVLETQGGVKPQVFTLSRGNRWVADITNAQLRLPQGLTYREDNPFPGIESVAVVPLDTNSVRVIVTGQGASPIGQGVRRERNGLVMSFNPAPTAQANATAVAPTPAPMPAPTAPMAGDPAAPVSGTFSPGAIAQTPAPATPAAPTPPLPSGNPTGFPPVSPGASPPFLPRAVAPPVGDITVSTINVASTNIDLGTNERVPRLVLRDAPVREVLALLARAAGLNVAYADSTAAGATAPAAGTTTGGATISLDVENESVQDVFNYVLRLSGLQANRTGRTIFVGQNLPSAARDLVMRTVRLNQIKADLPQVAITSSSSSTSSTSSAGGTGATSSSSGVTRSNAASFSVPVKGALQLLQDLGASGPGGAAAATPTTGGGPEPVLRGLLATADSRTNTITLLGTPRQVDIATSYLTQVDVRKRQVAVNVKIVQVTLGRNNSFSSNFSFGVNDIFLAQQNGTLDVNVGRIRPAPANAAGGSPPVVPASTLLGGGTLTFDRGVPLIRNPNFLNEGVTTVDPNTGQRGVATPVFATPLFQYPNSFLASLLTQIQDNNAKVLTDPTLIVQEGTQSQVNLTTQVLTNLQQQVIVPTSGAATVSLSTQFTDVGVILNVAVDQIDDNGFVTMSVSPEVSAPGNAISITLPGSGGGGVTNQVIPVNRRRLETGQVRLRDGQTLILTGIITEQETQSVSKVPILGDLPLIGSLFRNTVTDNSRTEVVVLVTPQIMDDSQQSGAGYSYTPSPSVQQMLRRGSSN